MLSQKVCIPVHLFSIILVMPLRESQKYLKTKRWPVLWTIWNLHPILVFLYGSFGPANSWGWNEYSRTFWKFSVLETVENHMNAALDSENSRWKCMLLNISDQTQPWTQAVRMVLASVESHTWTFFVSWLRYGIKSRCISLVCFKTDLTFLPCSPWCRILWISGCPGRTPLHNSMVQSLSIPTLHGCSNTLWLTDSTHRLHDGKYHGRSGPIQAE